jgi:adenosylmethionine-8-amino-7-oxononanoate aminotransferase
MTNPLLARDLAVLWHPCSQMQDWQGDRLLPLEKAEGCLLFLSDGRVVLDGISSWWCKSLGHRHPRLMAALVEQSQRIDHVIFAGTTNQTLVEMTERVLNAANGHPPKTWGKAAPAGKLPGFYGRAFLADNGSTAVEIALKLALHWQKLRGQSQRTGYAVLANGYHGETVGALSVSDLGLYSDPYRPLLFPVSHLGPLPHRSGSADPAWMDASSHWPVIEAQLAAQEKTLAAIVFEPVLQGAGGMNLYSPDLLTRLCAWAKPRGILCIADEIAAGMGRLGHILASHIAPQAQPDLVCLSKGLTGGVLPLSMVLMPDAIAQAFEAPWHEGKSFLHSNTWCGNPLAAAVAREVLAVYAQEKILEWVQRLAPLLRQGFQKLPLQNLRSLGFMAAADLTAPSEKRLGFQVSQEAARRGLLIRSLGNTLYLCPPLIATEEDISEMLRILAEAIDATLKSAKEPS